MSSGHNEVYGEVELKKENIKQTLRKKITPYCEAAETAKLSLKYGGH
jgi:hypothetical protein